MRGETEEIPDGRKLGFAAGDLWEIHWSRGAKEEHQKSSGQRKSAV